MFNNENAVIKIKRYIPTMALRKQRFIYVVKKVRYWIIRQLFTADEKWMLTRAIEDRCDNLNKHRVTDFRASAHNAWEDVCEYNRLRSIFSTRDWT